MAVVKNNTSSAREVSQKIYDNGGYCCCAVVKDEDTICICKDFRDKIQDPTFYGECNCGLYVKTQ